MKRICLKYLFIFLILTVFLSNIFTPVTVSKYTEKHTKKITINAVQPTYIIVFNSNGGSGSMQNQIFTYKTPQRLSENQFTNGDLAFNGWNTESNGGGTSFYDKELINNLSSTNGDVITLYAQWIDKVARIGNVYYDTLTDAVRVANVSNSQTTIVLLKDTNENITIKAGKDVILDLNNKTIGNVGNDNTIKNNGILYLKNGNVINNAPTNGAINNYQTGTIIIDNVYVNVYGTGGRQALFNDKGTAIITGGSSLNSKATERPAVTNNGNGNMTILDATITSTGSVGIKNMGTLTIGTKDASVNKTNPAIIGINYAIETNTNLSFYDGVMKGKYHTIDHQARITDIEEGYSIIESTEEINGVTYYTKFLGKGVTITFDPNGGEISPDDATKSVMDGSEVGELPDATKTDEILVGWFTDPEGGEEVFENRTITDDVTFYAHWENVEVARIGDVTYSSVQAAVNAASGSTRIELLKDTSEVVDVPSSKNIILDLNGKTLSNKGNNAVITNHGTLRITGGTITSNADTAAINQKLGTLNMSDGTIRATGTRQTIYITGGVVNISGSAYLSSRTEGTPPETTMQRGTIQCLSAGTLNITGGTIVAERQHAITNEGTLTIGSKDGAINTTSPSITGNIDGVRSTGTFNFYDGIIRGKTNAINGNTDDIETGSAIIDGTDGDYITAHLEMMSGLFSMAMFACPLNETIEDTDNTNTTFEENNELNNQTLEELVDNNNLNIQVGNSEENEEPKEENITNNTTDDNIIDKNEPTEENTITETDTSNETKNDEIIITNEEEPKNEEEKGEQKEDIDSNTNKESNNNEKDDEETNESTNIQEDNNEVVKQESTQNKNEVNEKKKEDPPKQEESPKKEVEEEKEPVFEEKHEEKKPVVSEDKKKDPPKQEEKPKQEVKEESSNNEEPTTE